MSATFDGETVENAYSGTSGTISYVQAKMALKRMNPGTDPTYAQIMAFRGNWDTVVFNRRNPHVTPRTVPQPDTTVNTRGGRSTVIRTSRRMPGAVVPDRRGDAATGRVGITPRAGDVVTDGAPPMPPPVRVTRLRRRARRTTMAPGDAAAVVARLARTVPHAT